MLPEAELNAERAFRNILTKSRDDRFEDGMFNTLSRSVPGYIDQFGVTGVLAVRKLLDSGIDPDALAETLLLFGRLDSPPTLDSRLDTLVASLNHPLPSIRDASALALATLRDHRAVPYLKNALGQEQTPLVRRSFQEVLNELNP